MTFQKTLKSAIKFSINFLIISFCISAMTGCGSDAKSGRIDRNTNFRFINAVSDVSSVDLFLDSKEYQRNVGYLESTGYSEEKTGQHDLQVTISGSANILVDTTTGFADARDQTLLVYGKRITPAFYLLQDNNEPASDQAAKIRMIQGASDNRVLDLYVLRTDTPIVNEQPAIARFTYKQVSSYVSLPKGSYDFTVTERDSKTPIAQSRGVSLDGESVYTILIANATSANPLRIVAFKDR